MGYALALHWVLFCCRAATIKKDVVPVTPHRSIFSDLSSSIQEWKWPPVAPPSDNNKLGAKGHPGRQAGETGAGHNSSDGAVVGALSLPSANATECRPMYTSDSHEELPEERPVRKILEAKREAQKKREARTLQAPHVHSPASPSISRLGSTADYTYSISQEEVDPNVPAAMTSSQLHNVQYRLRNDHSTATGRHGTDEFLRPQEGSRHLDHIHLHKCRDDEHTINSPAPSVVNGSSNNDKTATSLIDCSDHALVAANRSDEAGEETPSPNTHRESESDEACMLTVHELAGLSYEAITDSDFGRTMPLRVGDDVYADRGHVMSLEGGKHNGCDQLTSQQRDADFIAALESEMKSLEVSATRPATVDTSTRQVVRIDGTVACNMCMTVVVQRTPCSQYELIPPKQEHVRLSNSGGNKGLPTKSSVTGVTVSRGIIHQLHVPPPPPSSGDSSIRRSHGKLRLIADNSSQQSLHRRMNSSVLQFADKATNTPLPSLSNHLPCPNCRCAQAEILFLRSEVCFRHSYVSD